MKTYKEGDIVRYSGGCTALVKLSGPHAGGWHGAHCMGGSYYVTEEGIQGLADEEDMRMWKKCAWYRGQGIPPDYRPRIFKKDGLYQYSIPETIPKRWMEFLGQYMVKAKAFVDRMNQQ